MCPCQLLENKKSLSAQRLSSRTTANDSPKPKGQNNQIRAQPTALLTVARIARDFQGITFEHSQHVEQKKGRYINPSGTNTNPSLGGGRAWVTFQDSEIRQTCNPKIPHTNQKPPKPLTTTDFPPKPVGQSNSMNCSVNYPLEKKGSRSNSHLQAIRSGSIAIPRQPNHHNEADKQMRELEIAYDKSTWQLYNRLTEYRKRKTSSALDSTAFSAVKDHHHCLEEKLQRNESDDSTERQLDDEGIFDLEL